MPEQPEIHTIVTGLSESLIGAKITEVYVSENYPRIENKNKYKTAITGKRIKKVHRIAKNVLIELDEAVFIHFHLAMTGRLLFRTKPIAGATKPHVSLKFASKSNKSIYLDFFDVRMFGKSQILTQKELENLKQKYGADLLALKADTQIFVSNLHKILSTKSTNIKNILMDQAIISGLGNIYATEALFLSKIHPTRPAKSLNLPELNTLIENAKIVLEQGIKNRGSTLPDKMYVDIWGKFGNQQNYLNVYLKEKCNICGSKIDNIKISGRSTYVCNNCQK